MKVMLSSAVQHHFPGLQVFMSTPVIQNSFKYDLSAFEQYVLSKSEQHMYRAFRQERELLADRSFRLAIELYADNLPIPGTDMPSHIRAISAYTGIPLGVLPYSAESPTLVFNDKLLVLCRGESHLGHFSVQSFPAATTHDNQKIVIISYIPEQNQELQEKVESCLKLVYSSVSAF